MTARRKLDPKELVMLVQINSEAGFFNYLKTRLFQVPCVADIK